MKQLASTLFVLVVLVFVFALLVAPAALAQDCLEVCGGPNTYCDTPCDTCDVVPDIGLNCPKWAFHSITCGDMTNFCYETGCSPDWQEISRETQGTYGEGWVVYCEHHSVEWVTQEDMNHCMRNSYGWYQSYCHDEMDGYKFGTSSVDCCDGLGPDGLPDSTFTCNHYHHCTG